MDVPIDRIRVLRPLAAPVSPAGTALMMSVGIAEYAIPTPVPMTAEMMAICQTEVSIAMPPPYPAPITTSPSISETFGPRVVLMRADSGDTSIIAAPIGATHSPATTIDWPRP